MRGEWKQMQVEKHDSALLYLLGEDLDCVPNVMGSHHKRVRPD